MGPQAPELETAKWCQNAQSEKIQKFLAPNSSHQKAPYTAGFAAQRATFHNISLTHQLHTAKNHNQKTNHHP